MKKYMNISRVILVLMGVLLSDVKMQTSLPLASSYMRLNWGTIFINAGKVLNGISKYKHTFGIAIPNCTYVPLNYINCTTHPKLLENCYAMNDMIASLNNDYVTEFSNLQENLDVTLSAMGEYAVKFERSLRPPRRRKKRDTYLPANFCDDRDEYTGGNNVIANVVSSLFGVPTNSQVITVLKHVCELADVVKLNSEEIQNSNEYLSSISNILNKRITNIQDGVDQLNVEIAQQQAGLYTLTNELNIAVGNISEEMEKLLISQQQMYILFGQLHFYETRLTATVNGIKSWIAGAHTLMSGYLPPTMISAVDISKLLTYISQTVLKDPVYQNRLYIVHRNPMYFYQYKDLSYTRDTRYVYISINVPLAASGGLLTVYRVDKLNLGIVENKTYSTRLVDVPEYFAISDDRNFYTELTAHHYLSCEGENVKVCPFEQSLKRSDVPTCISSLFHNDATNIKALCNFVFEDRPVPPQTIMLDNNRYWIHSNNATSDEKWYKFCIRDNKGVTATIQACKNCIIEMPCACSLRAASFQIPLNLQNCNLFALNHTYTDIVLSYPINLPFLSHFQPVDQFLEISSNQTMHQPLNLNIHFNITRFNWSDVVERDRYFSIDFKRLIEQEKLHNQVFVDGSAKLLAEALNVTDIHGKKVDESIESLGRGIFDFLSNPKTTIANLSLNSVLAFSAIVACMGTCWMVNAK